MTASEKTLCVFDLDDHLKDGGDLETIEVQQLAGNGGWMPVIKVPVGSFQITGEKPLFHPLFKVVLRGQSSQENEELKP